MSAYSSESDKIVNAIFSLAKKSAKTTAQDVDNDSGQTPSAVNLSGNTISGASQGGNSIGDFATGIKGLYKTVTGISSLFL